MSVFVTCSGVFKIFLALLETERYGSPGDRVSGEAISVPLRTKHKRIEHVSEAKTWKVFLVNMNELAVEAITACGKAVALV